MTVIEAAIQYIQTLFAGNAGGHGADHTMRVYRNAMLIAQKEPGCDAEVTALAALLHDADDHKLFHTADNENARAFLAEHGVEPEKTEKICAAVNSVSFSRNRGKDRPRSRGKSSGTRTGSTRSERSESRGPLPTAESTAGRWRRLSGTLMKSSCS